MIKIKEISQIAIVVKNLDKSMKMYWEILGIGPWSINTFAPPKLTETYLRGKKSHYTMRVALAEVGSMMIELIEALEGESIYKEFLKEKGEGLHHIACFKYNSFEEVQKDLEGFEKMGIKVLQSGKYENIKYYYLDTELLFGTIYEIGYVPLPPITLVKPERFYPSNKE